MDPSRAARFLAKLEHAEGRLALFQEWWSAAHEHLKDRLAAYKAYQEAVEALVDVCAMAVKEIGTAPKDDYGNIDVLERNGMLSGLAAETLRRANGLRNRLIHEYNGLRDELALASAGESLAGLAQAIVEVRTWLAARN